MRGLWRTKKDNLRGGLRISGKNAYKTETFVSHTDTRMLGIMVNAGDFCNAKHSNVRSKAVYPQNPLYICVFKAVSYPRIFVVMAGITMDEV